MSFTISYLSSSLDALLSLITRGVRHSPLFNITLLNFFSFRRNLPKDVSCLVFGSRTIFQFIIKCVCLCAWDGLINLERAMDKSTGRKAKEGERVIIILGKERRLHNIFKGFLGTRYPFLLNRKRTE